MRSGTRYFMAGIKRILCLSVLGLTVLAPRAGVMITLANGVKNPAPTMPSMDLEPTQYAVADTATLVPVADISGVLQATLNGKGSRMRTIGPWSPTR